MAASPEIALFGLKSRGPPGQQLPGPRHHALDIERVGYLLDGDERELLRRVSKELTQRRVDIQEPPIHADQRHADRSVLERVAESLLRFAQCHLQVSSTGESADALRQVRLRMPPGAVAVIIRSDEFWRELLRAEAAISSGPGCPPARWGPSGASQSRRRPAPATGSRASTGCGPRARTPWRG